MNILENNSSNILISELIKRNEPFAISRLGILELRSLCWSLINRTIPGHLIGLLQNNAGVYGDNIHTIYNSFFNEYCESIKNCNIHVVWDTNDLIEQQKIIFDALSTTQLYVTHKTVEPFYYDDPCSQHLYNKKVLIISPFSNTIYKQYYDNRTKIWNNQKILPKFNLITYKSIQSIGNTGPHNNWLESLNIMKNDISNINFDIALLGCGAYGNPLVSYIYKYLNKTAIYVGGGLQLIFGIKGKRWESFPDINCNYNDSWVRPSINETPQAALSVEEGCYW